MEKTLHRLLYRQLRNFSIDEETIEQIKPLLVSISNSYEQFEKERKLQDNNSRNIISKTRSSNEKLSNIIETIDSFNYHVSHDLKTSMINNISLTKMVKKYASKNDRNKTDQILDKLEYNATSGLQLIEKFLEVSKFESKIKANKRENWNIKDLVENIVFDLDLGDKIEVIVYPNEFSELFIEEISIRSILQNFITNAYKYSSPERHPKLEISLNKDPDYYILEFKDNGMGIDLEKYGERLFKPFERLPNKGIEGTGVGLFIIKKTITAMGGNLKVISKLTKGSTFTISIPQNTLI